jgi:pilus assembly protein CpaC
MRANFLALLAAGTFLGLSAPVWTAQAQPPAAPGDTEAAKPAPVHASITLSAGNGQVLHLNAGATNVFTADPKVAEVRPASANSLFVFGVAPGATTVAALDASGALIGQYQVTVVPSNFDASMAGHSIGRSAQGSVRARANETGVTLSGHVATPADAEKALLAAKGSLPADGKVDNELKVDEPVQVSLHVRVAEMTRTLTRELGINWQAIGALGKNATYGVGLTTNNALSSVTNGGATAIGAQAGCSLANSLFSGSGGSLPCTGSNTRNWDLSTVIDALSQDQLVHVLAEPNLTTMSGQPASFLVGGEFPIPISGSTGNVPTISVDFKQYGISLAFVPTVMSHNRISLHVRPEVSQLDKADSVTTPLGNNTSVSIPALTVRRADTTVELGSGQSFAIAGLLSDQTTQSDQSTPGLGDVPILGALFRSESFQRGQTELVIIVTPYIVRPINDPSALHLPSDGWKAPNDFERILQLRQVGRGANPYSRRMPADAGFMVE